MNSTSAPSSEKLALFGGKPAINDPDFMAYRWPFFSKEEKEAVSALVERTWFGDYYKEQAVFEKELCNYFGSKYAISLINGTAALHSGAFGAGFGPGDEVITPSYTYWATVMPLRLVGARPVFADILAHTGQIDPADIERNITEKTKGIMLVHLWGQACDMDAIMKIAEKHKLKVVEDCSHAHGATYKGKKVGTFGAAGCFSMQCSKVMPGIEGGFLLTDDFDVYGRAMALGHYGRIPEKHPLHVFNSTGLGYKYRIHPVASILGLGRLKSLDQHNAGVVRRMRRFFDGIAGLPGIEFFPDQPGINRVYFQAEIKYREEVTGVPIERIVEAIKAEGANIALERYPLQHRQPIYREAQFWNNEPLRLPDSLPGTELLHECVLQIPTFPACDDQVVDQYIATYQKVWRNLDQLKPKA